MSARDLAAVGLLGTAAWAVWRYSGATLPPDLLAPVLGLPDAIDGDSGGDVATPPPSYAAAVAGRESGGNTLAKNPRSSASGAFQFTRSTWIRMGGAWGSDPSKAFGGLTPGFAEQMSRFERLSAQNAAGLARAGINASEGALYAAHFLGLPRAVTVLKASPSTPLARVVPSAVLAANPQLRGFTVADFISWARGKA